ncbi:MAG: lipoprotein [Burkholderiaceae bacterium]|jgi:predicted small lipoprotein YifL|nr:lipoprotein [Burkholderiaceae bacterium]
MLRAIQILVSAFVLATSVASLGGCGQRGPLFLPTEGAAQQRATLPQTLTPGTATPPSPSAPASTATR